MDNLARATDMLYAGFHLNDKFSLTAGKMCQAWGGFEFDINPMNIYEYSDFIDNMDNFMLGGMLTYHPNENHEFNIQITDVCNNTFQELYGDNTLGIEESKVLWHIYSIGMVAFLIMCYKHVGLWECNKKQRTDSIRC